MFFRVTRRDIVQISHRGSRCVSSGRSGFQNEPAFGASPQNVFMRIANQKAVQCIVVAVRLKFKWLLGLFESIKVCRRREAKTAGQDSGGLNNKLMKDGTEGFRTIEMKKRRTKKSRIRDVSWNVKLEKGRKETGRDEEEDDRLIGGDYEERDEGGKGNWKSFPWQRADDGVINGYRVEGSSPLRLIITAGLSHTHTNIHRALDVINPSQSNPN